MSTQLEERTDTKIDEELEQPKWAHIVDRGGDTRPAQAVVLEAFVLGTTVYTLCGKVITPSRDATKFPVCPECKEMYEFAKDFRGV